MVPGPATEAGARPHRVDRPGGASVPGAAVAALAAALLVAGCGDGGMGMDDRPAELVRVSAAEDTVLAEETLDDSVAVRVEDASGRPFSGVSVAFEVASGSGSVEPDTVSTGADGEARTAYRAVNTSGTARVRASLPGTPDVEPLEFAIQVVPPNLVFLRPAGGDGQAAEPGSQLPEALAVRTVAGDNDPVGGVRVAWAVEEAPDAPDGAEARLTADTVFSDADGRARTLLNLAGAEGEHRVRAAAVGHLDTVRFTAEASAGAVGDVALDSVRPAPLRAGEDATLFGSGFGDDASAVTVTVEGVEATVESAAGGRLEVRVPGFEDRCLPARTVGVRVRTEEQLGNGRTVELRPVRAPLDLAPGEVATLTSSEEVRCVQLAGADAEREYRLQVQSAARNLAVTPMRLVARSGPASGATPDLRMVGRRREAAFADREPAALASRRELELRRNVREELRRRGARPARPGRAGPDGRLRTSHASGPPSPGDTIGVNFYVRPNLTITCEDTLRRIGAEVRAVGERVVLAEDTLAREVDGFDDADYGALRDEFDRAIFATDSAYFGSPTDIDHNERVVVLITPEVNQLTPSSSSALIAGFFSSADLADSGDGEGDGTNAGGTCATSNEGELLYLLAPDPPGEWGPEVPLDEARQNVRGTSAHEHQHLLNAGTRVIREGGDFSDLLETWLDEGLSHVAEEVVGLRVLGSAPRRNLTFQEAGARSGPYDAFFLQNLLRLATYYRDPGDARTLSGIDPGGQESLEMRGFAWSFLRWLADTRVPDGEGGFLGGPREEELFRAMATGGPELLTGVDAVLRAVERVSGTRPAWGELVAEFSPVAHVDDDVDGVDVRFTFPSWDLRDHYAGLGTSGGYPLSFTDAGFTTTAYEFELRGSTQIYFRLASDGAAPPLSLRLGGRLGGPVTEAAAPQITVVRVR